MSFKLYASGEFGNKLRTWEDLNSLLIDTYSGTVTMRYAGKYNKWCSYNISKDKVRNEILRWESEGADISLIRFNESAPDENLIIQGEISEDSNLGLILSYSTDKVKMRQAMENPKECLGWEALAMLKKHLSPLSRINVSRLLARYSGAVIEFSTYNHMLGNIPKNNTIFW